MNHFTSILNKEARSDIKWWYQFAETWNGVSMPFALDSQTPAANVTSDTLGSWGCGAPTLEQ